MTIPRLAALVSLLLLNRVWRLARFDMPLRQCREALLMGAAPTALWTLYFSGSSGEAFTPLMMLVGVFTSMAVGAFEEYAFRGPLLSALCERVSAPVAVLVSNSLFMAYHFQAQSTEFWPGIFLTGVVFANLRLLRLSLGWLAAIHSLIDAVWFMFPSRQPSAFGFYGLVWQAGLLAYAVRTFPRSSGLGTQSGRDRHNSA